MSDIILPTHPLEFQNNRQATKITYLQQEIQHLQDYVKDLEQLVKINKDALKLMTNQQTQQNLKLKVGSQDDITTSLTDQSQKNFYFLYEQSQEENYRLLKMIEKLKKERIVAQSKALISEQICEETQRHEMEAISELEQKIIELRKNLQDKEGFIQHLEKIKPFPFQEGVVVKYREVMDANEQNMKLHDELTKYKTMLAKVSKEMNKFQREKEELSLANTTLNNELAKFKAILAHPMGQKHRLSAFAKGNENHHKSIAVNEKCPSSGVLKLPDDQSFTSSRNSSPQEEKPNKSKKLALFNKKKSKTKTIPLRPRNDAAYQSTNALYDIKLLEKISNLETEVENTKEKLSREMMNNELLSDELSKLKRAWINITATNEILCKSNKKYQEKRSEMIQTIEFYKGFYHKYLDLVKNRKAHNRSDSFSLPNSEKAGKLRKLTTFEPKGSPGYFNESSDDKLDKLVNLSGGELNNDQIFKEQKTEEEKAPKTVYNFNKEQSKAYLLILAKEFHENHPMNNPLGAKNMIKQIEKRHRAPHPKNRVKRSLSNPLDYIFERKKVIYEPISEEIPKNTGKPEKPEKDEKEKKKEEAAPQANDLEGNKASDSFHEDLHVVEKLPKIHLRRFISSAKKKDEMEDVLSFTVDSNDLDKVKNNNQSFMSNNDILRTLE